MRSKIHLPTATNTSSLPPPLLLAFFLPPFTLLLSLPPSLVHLYRYTARISLQDVRRSDWHVEADGWAEARTEAAEAVEEELRYQAPSSELFQL